MVFRRRKEVVLVLVQKASKRKIAEEEAREKIAEIRRNGFDPGDAVVKKTSDDHGLEKAAIMLRVAARAYRKIVPVH